MNSRKATRINCRKLTGELLESRVLFAADVHASSRTLTLTSWQNNAIVDGSNTWDTLVLQQDTNFTLRSGSVTSGGKTLYYRNSDNLKIVGGASANQFTLLPGFDNKIGGKLSLDARGGNDTLNLGGNQGLDRDVNLYQAPHSSPGDPSILKIGGRVIEFSRANELPENLSIRGTDRENTYKIMNYSGDAKIDGAGGLDNVILGGSATNIVFNLNATSNRVDLGTSSYRLFNLERLQVEGDSGNQTFDFRGNLSSWRYVAVVGGEGYDTIKAPMPGGSGSITNYGGSILGGLTIAQFGGVVLNEIESFNITGTSNDDFLQIMDWKGDGIFAAGGGTDKVALTMNSYTTDARFGSNWVELGFDFAHGDGFLNRLDFRTVDSLSITGTDADNFIDARDYGAELAIYGQGGNDILFGRMGGRTHINGGDGDDWIVGGNAGDTLNGDDLFSSSGGADILIGGNGADTIVGDNNQDILIGGNTSYDYDLDAIFFIRDFWATDFQKFGTANAAGIPTSGRIGTLFNDGVENFNTGEKYYLRTNISGSKIAATVFDDGVTDELYGDGRDEAPDWYFANLVGPASSKDKVEDLGLGNVITEL